MKRIALIAAAALIAGSTATATAATASAATACKTTTTHTRTAGSGGAASERWTLKTACGKDYEEWAHGWSRTRTGASTTWHLHKVMRFPCWHQHRVARSVSARGAVRNTVTDSSGGC